MIVKVRWVLPFTRVFSTNNFRNKEFLDRTHTKNLVHRIKQCGSNYNQAIDIFNSTRLQNKTDNVGVNIDIFNASLDVCSKENQFQEVWKLLDVMFDENLEPNENTFDIILNVYIKTKQWNVVLDICDEMVSRQLIPKYYPIHQVMTNYEKNGNYLNASKLLNSMEKRFGLKPDITCINATINSCNYTPNKHRYQWEDAISIFNKIENSFNLKPNEQSFNYVIITCAKSGQWDKAINFLKQMMDLGLEPSIISYSAAITACGNSGEWEIVLELIDKMKKKGVKPNVVCYSAAITACGKNLKWDKAVELLDSMSVQGVKPNVVCYSAAITACGKNLKWDKAVELLDSMSVQGVKPNVVCYSAAISACGKSGKPNKAVELLERMILAGVTPNTTTFNSVMMACEKGHQYHKVIELFDLMPKCNVLVDSFSYAAVMRSYSALGKWEECLEHLKLLKMNSMNYNFNKNNEKHHKRKQISIVKPNSFHYCAAITACGNGGQWEKALEIFNSMDSNVESKHTQKKEEEAKEGNVGRRVEDQEDSFHIPVDLSVECFNAIMSVCEKNNQLDTTIALFEKMISTTKQTLKSKTFIQPDVITLTILLNIYLKKLNFNKVLDILTHMELKYSLKPNNITFYTMILTCEKLNQLNFILDLFNLMKNNYNIEPNVTCYSAAISVCVKQNEWFKANEFLNIIENKNFKPQFKKFKNQNEFKDIKQKGHHHNNNDSVLSVEYIRMMCREKFEK